MTCEKTHHVTRKSDRRGATVVEFAFIAPVLFLVVFASIEFGRAMMAVHALEGAAREGCRVAIIKGATAEAVEDKVASLMDVVGISDYTMTMDPASPISAAQWQPVTVSISVSYQNISWLPVPQFLGGIPLTGTCTLPRESDS